MHPIVRNFLAVQQQAGSELAAASDLLDLKALDGPPAQHYLATFTCKGVVRTDDGGFAIAERFDIGLYIPEDFLECAEPGRMLFLFGPSNVLHPNIRPPFICPGRIYPGMPLVELLHQLFEMLTMRKLSFDEGNALNPSACVWARNHRHLFPVDSRPLRRRTVRFDVHPVNEPAQGVRS
jgi:hypothetical protein